MNRPIQVKAWMFWAAAVATGLMLSAAWPARGFTPLVFVAWVPLLWAEDYAYRRRKEAAASKAAGNAGDVAGKPRPYHVFLYALVAFLVWNVLTTYWIWNSTPAAALAWVANALLMAAVFWLYHVTTRRLPSHSARGGVLIVYWLAFEYIHHIWDISWPWLTLGNVFATQPAWVQWYEYTGTSGGSLWVLLVNMLFLAWCKATVAAAPKRERTIKAAAVCLAILLPVGGSIWRYTHYRSAGHRVETVVVQPNIDPYGEQYDIPPVDAVKRMLFLGEYALSPQTRFLVTPESMIQEYVWEHKLANSPSVTAIQGFLDEYPGLSVVAGISTYSRLAPEDSATRGARRRPDIFGAPVHYLAHNTVMVIDTASGREALPPYAQRPAFALRHKSKLTPAVEIMPLVDKIGFLEKWAIDLGGIVGTLGTDAAPKVFRSVRPDDTVCYADVICYESIFGDYVTGFCRKGAELLFISTNDGWWGDTPGHRQHAEYARLRAIENRRDIARSANTGISAFISPRGDVLQRTAYWEPAVIKHNMKTNRELTFYSRYGDMLGRMSAPVSLLLLLGSLVLRIVKRG
ncbi:MAG: apolipoprotein N-acyltransferase [Bacteroidales bacterium]|nr:apolipoprotein N-acyltransferase [Bacteroidales bacterium]